MTYYKHREWRSVNPNLNLNLNLNLAMPKLLVGPHKYEAVYRNKQSRDNIVLVSKPYVSLFSNTRGYLKPGTNSWLARTPFLSFNIQGTHDFVGLLAFNDWDLANDLMEEGTLLQAPWEHTRYVCTLNDLSLVIVDGVDNEGRLEIELFLNH